MSYSHILPRAYIETLETKSFVVDGEEATAIPPPPDPPVILQFDELTLTPSSYTCGFGGVNLKTTDVTRLGTEFILTTAQASTGSILDVFDGVTDTGVTNVLLTTARCLATVTVSLADFTPGSGDEKAQVVVYSDGLATSSVRQMAAARNQAGDAPVVVSDQFTCEAGDAISVVAFSDAGATATVTIRFDALDELATEPNPFC